MTYRVLAILCVAIPYSSDHKFSHNCVAVYVLYKLIFIQRGKVKSKSWRFVKMDL